MSLGPESLQVNLDLSVNYVIKQRFEPLTSTPFGGTYAGRVFYEDALADPTALDQRRTALRYWVGIQFIMPGVGLHLPTIAQMDFYTAVGDSSNQSTSDRWGHKLSAMVQDFIGIWSPSDVSFPVLDFSNLAAPAPCALPTWFMVKNSRSMWGWPEERIRMIPDKGLNHEVVTYHFWHQADLEPSQPIYF